jgi:hypothetical protein
MFIAVGVVECHGLLPIDCETILPKHTQSPCGKGRRIGDDQSAIFLSRWTVISNATVSFSIRDGIEYLNKICHSLVAQGFRKLFILTDTPPQSLTVNAFCRDFFEETLITPVI